MVEAGLKAPWRRQSPLPYALVLLVVCALVSVSNVTAGHTGLGCTAACAPGGGCFGDAAPHCAALTATRDALVLVLRNASRQVAVRVPRSSPRTRARVVDVGARATQAIDAGTSITAWALRYDGTVWAADVPPYGASASTATLLADIGRPASTLACGAHSRGVLYANTVDGGIVRIDAHSGAVARVLSPAATATAVAAAPDPSDPSGVAVFYGTAGGAVVRVRGDGHGAADVVDGLGSKVVSLAVDSATQRVTWSTEAGDVQSSSWNGAGVAAALAVDLQAAVGAVAVARVDSSTEVVQVLSHATPPVEDAARVLSPLPAFQSLSALTQGDGAGSWAPDGTLAAQDYMGQLGNAIAPLLDVDQDGIPDMAVGVPLADTAASVIGGAVLLLTQDADGRFTLLQQISADGGLEPAVVLPADAMFGSSVAGFDDVDDDGVPEMAVGAPSYNNHKGSVWFIRLTATGTARSAVVTASDDMDGAPLGVGDIFGIGLCAMPDLDGDGRQELVVGAYLDDDDGADRGAVYVLFLNGDDSYRSHVLVNEASDIGWQAIRGSDVQSFGVSVAAVAWPGNDGQPLLVVGAHGDDDGAEDAGAAYAMFVDADSLVSNNVKLSAANDGLSAVLQLSGGDFWGTSVAFIGDLDGDGASELLVGAKGGDAAGYVDVLFLNGDASVRDGLRLSDAPGDLPPGSAAHMCASCGFGTSVAGFPHPSLPDATVLAVAAPSYSEGEATDAGAVLVVTVQRAPEVHFDNAVVELSSATEGPGDGDWAPTGTVDRDGWLGGWSNAITAIDDVDGDGMPDVVIGQSGHDAEAGAVLVVRQLPDGSGFRLLQLINAASGLESGVSLPTDKVRLGRCVAGLADVDGDGVPELAVTAAAVGDFAGEVWVMRLTREGSVRNATRIGDAELTGTALESDDFFGGSLCELVDLDGDGRNELAAGVFGSDATNDDGGAVFVLFLNGDDSYREHVEIVDNGAAGWTSLNARNNIQFGFSLGMLSRPLQGAGAAASVIVGAPNNDDGGTKAGSVYVVGLAFDDGALQVVSNVKLSATEGGVAAAGLSLSQGQQWGVAVAAIADLDGDGVDEAFVGSRNTGGVGMADIVFLSPSGRARASVRLSRGSSSLLPGAVKDRIVIDSAFGCGLAELQVGNATRDRVLAVASPFDDAGEAEGGAVFVIRMRGGARFQRSAFATSTSELLPDATTVVELSPAGAPPAGIVMLPRACDEGCGGDCVGAAGAKQCDVEYGCASGHAAAAPGGECCPIGVDGRAPLFNASAHACGLCDASCAACDGPGPLQCLAEQCAEGHWWTGSECLRFTECGVEEFEVSPPMALSDRSCGACSGMCVAGFGCTGPQPTDCHPATLSAVGNELLWVLPGGRASGVAARLNESGAAFVTHVDVDARAQAVGVAYALRSDGSMWMAQLRAAEAANAVQLAALRRSGVSMSAGAARRGVLYVATDDGAVVAVDASTGFVTPLLPASMGALSVAAAVVEAAPHGVWLFIGTDDDTIVRAGGDGSQRRTLRHDARARHLAVDAASERVVWSDDDDALFSASWHDGSDRRTVASSARAAVGGVSVVSQASSTGGADVRFLSGSDARAPAAEDFVWFNEHVPLVEVSAATDGNGADDWAPAGTLLTGENTGGWYNSVANVGDVDGDGFVDIAVGTPGHTASGVPSAGALLLLRQLSSGAVQLLQRISSAEGLTLDAELPTAAVQFGSSVASIGDSDGDGIDEIVVGADGTDLERGAVWVIRVDSTGTAYSTVRISHTGLAEGGRFGMTAAGLPDVDGDGRMEVAAGAPMGSPPAVLIVFLNADDSYRTHTQLDQSGLAGWSPIGTPGEFGSGLAALTCTRVGAPVRLAVGTRRDTDGNNDAGAVYVLTLAASATGVTVEASAKLSSVRGGLDTIGLSPSSGNFWGSGAAAVDDLDGDGCDELLVGASYDTGFGYATLLFLNADDSARAGVKLSSASTSVLPEAARSRIAAGDRWGSSLAVLPSAVMAGGHALVIGAPYDTVESYANSGSVFVLHMTPPAALRFDDNVVLLSAGTQGDNPGSWASDNSILAVDALGNRPNAVSPIDDVDQDGHADLLAGTPLHVPAVGNSTGAVLVLRRFDDGGISLLRRISSAEGFATGGQASLDGAEEFGCSVAPLKDRDGDGVPEVVVGASATDADTGAIWVLRLNVKGKARTAVRIGNDEMWSRPLAEGDQFGLGMSAVPDLNGDGFEEVGVGAYQDVGDGTGIGAFYLVFLAADDGYASHVKFSDRDKAAWRDPGGSNCRLCGFSAAYIPGLGGSGIASVAVSAMGDTNGGSMSGAVYVLAFTVGGAGAVDHTFKLGGANADMLRLGVAPVDGDRWGSGVSSVPDIDGDGVDELLVGARRVDDYGFADLLFLGPADDVTAAVRLSRSHSSPLPPDAKAMVGFRDRFGTSVSAWASGNGATHLAIVVAVTGDGSAIVVVTVAKGADIMIASERDVDGEVEVTVEPAFEWPAIDRPLGLATAARACFEGCGGSCNGTSPADCDPAGGCAAGYARTADDNGACCPVQASGAATLFSAADGVCGGACHHSCAACDAPGELGCVPQRCADGYWWTGVRCAQHSSPCGDGEYEAVAPSPVRDHSCAACHRSCVVGSSCTGPLLSDCLPLGFSAVGDNIVMVKPNGNFSRVAATVPAAGYFGQIADVAAVADPRITTDGATSVAVWALRSEGTVWTANLTTSTTPVAQFVADIDEPALSLCAGAVRRGVLYVASKEGAIHRVNVLTGVVRALTSARTRATAVAATPEADDDGVLLYYGTADGEVYRARGDASIPILMYASDAAITAVAVDPASERVVWSTADGEVRSGAWKQPSDALLVASGLSDAVGAITTFARDGTGSAASVSVLHAALPAVTEPMLRFHEEVVELSAATEGGDAQSWAPVGTMQSVMAMGGLTNSVTSINDVDQDGLPDMVVGAPDYNSDGHVSVGTVLVLRRLVDGGAKLLQRINSDEGVVGVAGPLGSNGAYFGCAVAGLHDVDDDGRPELAVGSAGANAIYVFRLRDDGQARTAVTIRVSDIMQTGGDDRFGSGLCAVPDLDGDGREDLAVGAPLHDDTAGRFGWGAVFLLFLNDSNDSLRAHVKILESSGVGWVSIDGNINQRFGSSLAALSLPGRDAAALVVGTRDDDDGEDDAGAVYMLLLTADGVDVTVGTNLKFSSVHGGLSEVGIVLGANNRWGGSVGTLSDLDGDGIDEVMVGASDNTVDVLFYTQDVELRGSVRLSNAMGSSLPAAMRERIEVGATWGASVFELPPLRAGELPVLAVGAPGDNAASLSSSGAVFLLRLARPAAVRFEDRLVELSPLTQGSDASAWAPRDTVVTTYEMGGFGNGLAPLGDVDQDGVNDLAIGMKHYDTAEHPSAGAVMILRMSTTGDAQLLQLISAEDGVVPDVGASLDEATEQFGSGVAGLDDDDGDGVPELAVGAYKTDGWRGAVWLLRLTAAGKARSTVRIGNDEMDGSPLSLDHYFGYGLSALPDLDDDQRQELAVGAYGDNDGGTRRGAVYVLFLTVDHTYRSHAKISETSGVGWVPLHANNAQSFGTAVATFTRATDTGAVTIAASASADNDGFTNAGSVYILQFEVIEGTRDVRVVSNAKLSVTEGGLAAAGVVLKAQDRWGSGLAVVGDLDDDGLEELLVGATVDDGYGFADIVFLDEANAVRSSIRLSNSPSSPLPSSARNAIALDGHWGAGCALMHRDSRRISLAIASPRYLSNSGGVFIVNLHAGTQVLRASTTYAPQHSVEVSVAATLPTTQPASGWAEVVRVCDVGCAGGCASGPSAVGCDAASGCALGYQLTTDGFDACCPVGAGRLAAYFDAEAGQCGGLCHPSCAACDGPGAGSCLPLRCADGHWWTGQLCLPQSAACGVDEYEASAATDVSDRVCGACSDRCVAGFGCSGPLVDDCPAVTLTAVGDALVWLVEGRERQVAATVPPGSGTARIVDVGLDRRATAGGHAAFALRADGSIWRATVAADTTSVAVLAFNVGKPCVAFTSEVASLGMLFVVSSHGDVGSIDVKSGAVQWLEVSTTATAVTAAAVATNQTDVQVWFASSSGDLHRCDANGGNVTTVYNDAVNPPAVLSFDAAHQRLVLASEHSLVSVDASGLNEEVLHIASDMQPTVDDVTAAPRSVGTGDVLALSATAPRVRSVTDAVAFESSMLELSADTEGVAGAAWASVGTVGDGDQLGGAGNGISALGDVNGDGMPDMAIGVRYHDVSGVEQAGAVLVVTLGFDGSAHLLKRISAAEGTETGVVLDLAATHFGSAVAGLDDADGDGVPELAVGAFGADDSSGSVWVLRLTAAGTARTAARIGNAELTDTPLAAGDKFGWGLCAVPDLDGDGRQELAVGAGGDDDGGGSLGAVYVVFLNNDDTYAAHTKISDTSGVGWRAVNPSNPYQFGQSVASVGALDGGFWLVVGAPWAADGGGGSGAVYALTLELSPGVEDVAVTASSKISATSGGLAQAQHAPAAGVLWGSSVAAVTDLDGDGIEELLVGARLSGTAAVTAGYADVLFLWEDATVRAAVVLSQAGGSPLPEVARQRIQPLASWGSSVAAVASRGNRAVPALAIAAQSDDASGLGNDDTTSHSGGGAVFVVQLASPHPFAFDDDFFVEVSQATESNADAEAWAPSGTLTGNGFGSFRNGVTRLADVDQDGIDDMAVGELDSNGCVFVLRRLSTGNVKLLQRIAAGVGIAAGSGVELQTGGTLFGNSVAGLDDVDADGVPELAVGAPAFDSSLGAVWVMRLNSAGEVRAAAHIASSDLDGSPLLGSSWFGAGMVGIPDVDGDGRQELVVGAMYANAGGTERGAVFVLFLRADDAYRTHTEISQDSGVGWAPIDGHNSQRFGATCAVLQRVAKGVVIAVGAHRDSDTVYEGGAVYLIALSASDGGSSVESYSKLSGKHGGLAQTGAVLQAGDKWGASTAGVDDLDGDGVGELMVGATVGTGFGYVDVVFVNDDLSARASVRLSVDPASPLPAAARARNGATDRWGGSVAYLGLGATEQLELAVVATYDPGTSGVNGALFLLRLSNGPRVQRWRTATDTSPVVDGEPTLLGSWPPAAARPAGLAAVARVCDAGCAGSCVASNVAARCDAAAGCARGYHAVDGYCLPQGVTEVDVPPSRRAPVDVATPPDARVVAWAVDDVGGAVAFVGGRSGSALVHDFSEDGAARAALGGSTDVAGAVWADVDLDGDADLLVARNRQPFQLFVNGGVVQVMTDEASARGFAGVASVLSIAVGDCDGDRDVDVYLTAPEGRRNAVLLNDGGGYFVDAPAGDAADASRDGGAVAWFDADEDGDLDLIVARVTGGVAMFTNDGTCSFTSSGGAAAIDSLNEQLGGVASILVDIILADYNADGHLDVLAVPVVGDVVALEILPTSSATALAIPAADADARESTTFAAAAGDLLGSGRDQLLLSTSAGVRVLDTAALEDVTNATLHGWDSPRHAVTVASPVHIQGAVGLLVAEDGVGGHLYAPLREVEVGSGTLNVRVLHRNGLSFASVFGAVLRLRHPNGASSAARVVHGGGGRVQSAAVVRVDALRAAEVYALDVSYPSRAGAVTWTTHNVSANGTAVVDVRDRLAAPALSASPTAGCVPIGGTLVVSAVVDTGESGLVLSPTATLNELNNTHGDLDDVTSDEGLGVYTIEYVVRQGSPDWPQDELPLQLSLHDATYGVDSFDVAWPRGQRVACGDGTPPVALFEELPPRFTRDSDALFRLSCTELRCTYEFSLDGGPWQRVDASPDGEAADDAVASASNSGSVDGEGGDGDAEAVIPPSTRLLAAPAHYSNDRSPTFVVEIVGAAGGAVEYLTGDDGAPWVPASGSLVSLEAVNDGKQAIQLRAGPADASPTMYEWVVDSVAPAVAITSGPTDVPHGRVAFALSLSEEGCEVRYRMRSAPLGGDGAESTPQAAQAALDAAGDDAVDAEWNATADTALFFALPDGFAYQLEVFAVDRAGNEGGERLSQPFARPRCAPVPAATVKRVEQSTRGPVLTFDVAAPLLQARMRRGDGSWGEWLTTAAKLVDTASLRGDPPVQPGETNVVEARAFASCVPHEGLPEPARYAWTEPRAPAALLPVIAAAPLPVSASAAASFELTTTRPGEWHPLECAYGFAPQDATPDALRYSGGGDDGREPLWRACGAAYTLQPLQVGRHRLRVRVAGGDGADATHDWLVQSSQASVVSITGRDSGEHSLRVFATDRAGNVQVEEPHTFVWEVDRTLPGTQAVRAGPERSNRDAVEIETQCLDEPRNWSCTFCWTSDSLPSGCSGMGATTVSIAIPPGDAFDAPHTVLVAARDGAGNQDDTPVPVYWETDRAAPVVNATIEAARAFNGRLWTRRTRPTLSYAADEALAHATLQLEGAPPRVVPLQGSQRGGGVPVLDDGAPSLAHGESATVLFTPTDEALNTGDAAPPLRVTVDTEAPGVAVVAVPARRVNVTRAVLDVAGVDGDDDPLFAFHLTYQAVDDTFAEATPVDDDAWQVSGVEVVGAGPPNVTVSPMGVSGGGAETRVELTNLLHGQVYFVLGAAEDVAGNVGASVLLGVVAVDTERPAVRVDAAPANATAVDDRVTFDLEASEPGCRARMSLWYQGLLVAEVAAVAADTQRELRIEATGLSLLDGPHEVEIVVVDAAGNAAAAAVRHFFTVDTRAPVLAATLPLVDTQFTAAREVGVSLECEDTTLCAVAPTVTSGAVEVVGGAPFTSIAGGASGGLSFVANSEGRNIVELHVTDAAGNVGEPSTLEWVTDETQPWMRVLVRHGEELQGDDAQNEDTALPDAATGAYDWLVDTQETPMVTVPTSYSLPAPAILVSCGDPPEESQCVVSMRLTLQSATKVSCVAGGSSGSSDDDDLGDDDGDDYVFDDDDGGVGDDDAQSGVGGVDVAAFFATWKPIGVGPGAATPVLLPELEDGQWRAEFSAVDEAGNVQSNTSTVYVWFVDTVAPARPTLVPDDKNVQETSSTPAPSLTIDVQLEDDFSPLLEQAVVRYTVDVPAEAQSEADVRQVSVRKTDIGSIMATFTASDLDEGNHDVRVWVVDAAGNEGVPATLSWTRDGQLPQTRLVWRPAEVIAWATVPFTLQMLDSQGNVLPAGAHVEVQVQGLFADWRAMCDAKDPSSAGTLLEPGLCRVEIEAVDPGTYVLQARTVNAQGQADGDPVSARWTRQLCGRDQFAAINGTSGAVLCGSCPVGADCTDPLVTRDAVQAKPGYWTPPGSQDFDFYECVLDSCLGARVSDNGTLLPSGCKVGYTGRLCSLCEDGYFMQFRRCQPCPTTSEGSIGAIAGITVALICTAAVVFYIRNVLPISVGKVVVSFLQVVGSANVAFRIKWPSNFEGTMNAMKVAMLDVLTLTRASCAAPMTFYDSFAVTLSIFVGLSVAGIVAMVWLDSRNRRREKAKLQQRLGMRMAVVRAQRPSPAPNTLEDVVEEPRQQPRDDATAPLHKEAKASPAPPSRRGPRRAARGRGVRRGRTRGAQRRSTLAIAADSAGLAELHESVSSLRWAFVFKRLSQFWLLCYPGVSVKLMRVFKCAHIQSGWYLEADMRLECFTAEWALVAVIAAAMLVVYTVGLPLGIALWLRSRREDIKRDLPRTRLELGFLYELYGTRNGQYLWEVAELVRKLLLTSLVLFFSAGSPFQVCFALVMSAYAHVVHGMYRPFVDRATYLLQHASLAVTTFVFAMGMLFKVDGFGADSSSVDDGEGGNNSDVSDSDVAVLEALGLLLVVAVAGFLVAAFVVAVLQVRRKLAAGEMRGALHGGARTLTLLTGALGALGATRAGGDGGGRRGGGRRARDGVEMQSLAVAQDDANLKSLTRGDSSQFVRSNPLWSGDHKPAA